MKKMDFTYAVVVGIALIGSAFAYFAEAGSLRDERGPALRHLAPRASSEAFPTEAPSHEPSKSSVTWSATCVDSRGRIHYSDQPSYQDCLSGQDPSQLSQAAAPGGRLTSLSIVIGDSVRKPASQNR